MPKLVERNVVKQFNTIEELAVAYSVPVEPFKQTVASYNNYVAQGKDDEFSRYMNKKAKQIATPPFYGMRLLPKIHHCMGGVNINTQAQALDVATDKPIPGLYAAGEAVGGGERERAEA